MRQKEASYSGAEQKGTVRGMGLLPVTTVFEQEKRRTRVSGRFAKVGGALAEMSGVCYEGYEIHMGRTVLSKGTVPLVYMEEEGEQRQDGQNIFGGSFKKKRNRSVENYSA